MTIPAFLSLPDAAEIFTIATGDNAELVVYGLGGPAGAPALLFGHANGLAAGSYDPWLRLLARRVRVWAFDARGHGGSRWPAGSLKEVFSIERMAADLREVSSAVAARAGNDIAYVGHSLGAAAALRLAVTDRLPDWRALVIFEPPLFPPPGSKYYAEANAKQIRLIAGTLKRRPDWTSPDALYQRLKGRGMFARFEDAMLQAHCHATLKPKLEGGFTLCCPPAVEASIFASHHEADNWALLPRIKMALDLVGGDPATPDNDWISGALPDMAALIPQARLTQLSGTGHMLISEQPERCAALVLERIGVM